MFNSLTTEKNLTPKAKQTRTKILNTAFELFSRKGFDDTTIRQIAQAAGVVASNIYHYFPTKEHMVQAFYEQLHLEHDTLCQEYFRQESSLKKRLQFVLKTKIELALPYHRLSRALFRVAADPTNPLSPFSDQSSATREQSLAQFQQMVVESDEKISPPIKEILPRYLWLGQMGIILFWIHDRSPQSMDTFQLIDQSVNTTQTLLKMMQNPLFSPLRKKLLSIMKDFTPFKGGKHGQI